MQNRVQELCESRVLVSLSLISLMVSVDVKQHSTETVNLPLPLLASTDSPLFSRLS